MARARALAVIMRWNRSEAGPVMARMIGHLSKRWLIGCALLLLLHHAAGQLTRVSTQAHPSARVFTTAEPLAFSPQLPANGLLGSRCGDQADELAVRFAFLELRGELFHRIDVMHGGQRPTQRGNGVERVSAE